MAYRPSGPFAVPMAVLKASTRKVNGVVVKDYSAGPTLMCAFRTFGATEQKAEGLKGVVSAATVDLWYTPGISSGDRVRLLDDGSEWEVVGDPEDIERRHQWLQLKVRRIEGGA